MLTRLMPPREERDSGFTLIELLVVVAIIGILAAIAIPLFLSQRDNAETAAAEAELKNAATQIEVAYTDGGSYPADQAASGIRAGEGRTLTYAPVAATATDPATYTLSINITAANCDIVWDPSTGTTFASGTGGTTCTDVGGTTGTANS